MPALAQRHLFTVGDYHKMAETGILSADDRVELIAGEIVEMSPIGSRHAGCINRLIRWLAAALGDRAILSVQNPLRLDDLSEPEPDVVILRPREDFYADAHPGPEDVLWLIEVSDSSLVGDRQVKLPLYAAHRIPEVWIVSLIENLVEVHRQPVEGRYLESRQARRDAQIAPKTFPTLAIPIEAMIG